MKTLCKKNTTTRTASEARPKDDVFLPPLSTPPSLLYPLFPCPLPLFPFAQSMMRKRVRKKQSQSPSQCGHHVCVRVCAQSLFSSLLPLFLCLSRCFVTVTASVFTSKCTTCRYLWLWEQAAMLPTVKATNRKSNLFPLTLSLSPSPPLSISISLSMTTLKPEQNRTDQAGKADLGLHTSIDITNIVININ